MADEKSSVGNKPVSTKPKEKVEESQKPKAPQTKPEQKTTQPKPEPKPAVTPAAFKKFLKQLIIISKKQKIKIRAEEALSKHLEKLKKTPAGKLDPKKLKRSLKRLDDKLGAVLDAEKKLAAVGREDPEIVKMLKDEIIGLKDKLRAVEQERNKYVFVHKKTVEGLSKEVSDLKGKVGTYAERKIDRQRRIKELEEKIKATPVKEHEIIAARKQLEDLERRYKQLSRRAYGKKRLEKLKAHIDQLKGKLAAEV
ncbi:hypothetical protein KY360_06135 [Candidatus Woesearchaeota archaeon]|nr:hypothetical protein [Candidatus Woesearchaeota archaeon]